MADSDQWTDRVEVKSETSDNVYTVSRRISTDTWECSCPGWKRFRKCKHLNSMKLKPTQLNPNRPAPKSRKSSTTPFAASKNITIQLQKDTVVPMNGCVKLSEWQRAVEVSPL